MKLSEHLDALIDRGAPAVLWGGSLWLWLSVPPIYAASWTFAAYVVTVRLIDWRRAKFVQNHALYRFYDSANRLLYIGITSVPRLRFEQHRAAKPWWSDIAVREITWYPNRALLAIAERDAIRRERPLYNVIHNGVGR